jgi:hypothetical protein
MNKSLLSYLLLFCSVFITYFYVSDYININSTNNFAQNSFELIKKQPLLNNAVLETWMKYEAELLWENSFEEQMYTLENFISDVENNSYVITVITWNDSILYIWILNQDWELNQKAQVKFISWFDAYWLDYWVESYNGVAIRWMDKTQDQVYAFMQEMWIADKRCQLDNEWFETYSAEDKLLVDDYFRKYKEYNEKWIEFVDDGTAPVMMCWWKQIYCKNKWCWYVFNIKNGWWGHWYMVNPVSLIIK